MAGFLSGLSNVQKPENAATKGPANPLDEIRANIVKAKLGNSSRNDLPVGRGIYVLNGVSVKTKDGLPLLLEFTFTCIKSDGTENGPRLNGTYTWAAFFNKRFGGTIWDDIMRIIVVTVGWTDEEAETARNTEEGFKTILDYAKAITGYDFVEKKDTGCSLSNVMAYDIEVNKREAQKKADGQPLFDGQGKPIMTKYTNVNFRGSYKPSEIAEGISKNEILSDVVLSGYQGQENLERAIELTKEQ